MTTWLASSVSRAPSKLGSNSRERHLLQSSHHKRFRQCALVDVSAGISVGRKMGSAETFDSGGYRPEGPPKFSWAAASPCEICNPYSKSCAFAIAPLAVFLAAFRPPVAWTRRKAQLRVFPYRIPRECYGDSEQRSRGPLAQSAVADRRPGKEPAVKS